MGEALARPWRRKANRSLPGLRGMWDLDCNMHGVFASEWA